MGSYVPRGSAGTFYFWGYGFAGGPKRIYGFSSYGGYRRQSVHVMRSHGLDRELLKSGLETPGVLHLLNERFEQTIRGKAEPVDVEKEKFARILADLHILNRADDQLSIPVFYGEWMEKSAELYQTVSAGITHHFMETLEELGDLVSRCSFSRCLSADVLCMLFHLAYSYAADTLVETGIVPEFPAKAAGEWGVWIH